MITTIPQASTSCLSSPLNLEYAPLHSSFYSLDQQQSTNSYSTAINDLFYNNHAKIIADVEELVEHLSYINLGNTSFQKKIKITKYDFFKKALECGKQIHELSWPPPHLKQIKKSPCAFREVRMTILDILYKVLEYHLQKDSDFKLLRLSLEICEKYDIPLIRTHQRRRSSLQPNNNSFAKKALLKTKKWTEKKIQENSSRLEKKIFTLAAQILETFNNQWEKEIYQVKTEELNDIFSKYYPFLSNSQRRNTLDSIYTNGTCTRVVSEESISTPSICLQKEPTQELSIDPLHRKIQIWQRTLPYVYPNDGFPYLPPKRLSIEAFCKQVCQLAKTIGKIDEPNSISELKQLRLDVLNRLDLIIEFLKKEIIQYAALPSPKPNYNHYHGYILKLGTKCQSHFQTIMETFNCSETQDLYNEFYSKWISRNTTFDLIKSNMSKCSCYYYWG